MSFNFMVAITIRSDFCTHLPKNGKWDFTDVHTSVFRATRRTRAERWESSRVQLWADTPNAWGLDTWPDCIYYWGRRTLTPETTWVNPEGTTPRETSPWAPADKYYVLVIEPVWGNSYSPTHRDRKKNGGCQWLSWGWGIVAIIYWG